MPDPNPVPEVQAEQNVCPKCRWCKSPLVFAEDGRRRWKCGTSTHPNHQSCQCRLIVAERERDAAVAEVKEACELNCEMKRLHDEACDKRDTFASRAFAAETAKRFAESRVSELAAERDKLKELINCPHNDDWFDGTRIEAAHQQERWGAEHDEGKEPQDWFWLVGYLAGKCLRSSIDGDIEKAKHHTISTAAAMLNWYRRISGQPGDMRPGILHPPTGHRPGSE